MTVYLVDHDADLLKEYKAAILADFPKASVTVFTEVKALLEQAKNERPDVVILDADMRNSMSTAKTLRELNAQVVFLSKDSERASTAIRISNAGYLLKPIGGKDLCNQIRPLVRHTSQKAAVLA